MDLPPDAGRAKRMARFDALPKPVRQTIANLDRIGNESCITHAAEMLEAGKPVKKVVAWLEKWAADKVARAPAERHAADLFLKELGL